MRITSLQQACLKVNDNSMTFGDLSGEYKETDKTREESLMQDLCYHEIEQYQERGEISHSQRCIFYSVSFNGYSNRTGELTTYCDWKCRIRGTM